MKEEIYDACIIGMGIAGISAAVYLKRANLNVLIIDKSMPGGLLNSIDSINNYPGFTNISGPDLAMNLKDQLDSLDVVQVYEEVRCLKSEDDYKIIETNNEIYKAKYVIIATGRSQKTLGIPGEKDLIGKGISSCALCDGNFFRDEEVALVGGGNSALQEALYLAKLVKKLYIIHRRGEFSASESLIEKINNSSNIEVLFNNGIKELLTEDDYLSGVVLNDGTKLDVKGLFVYVGFTPKTKFIEELNITNEKGYILVNNECETSISGIYAVGDIIDKRTYQLVTAACDGVRAAVDIIDKLK